MIRISEAVAKRQHKYGPEPNKESMVRWCIENGFEKIMFSVRMDFSYFKDNNCYCLGPNTSIPGSDWLKVHNKNLASIIFWFGKDGNVYDIEYIKQRYGMVKKITFEEASEILLDMVK